MGFDLEVDAHQVSFDVSLAFAVKDFYGFESGPSIKTNCLFIVRTDFQEAYLDAHLPEPFEKHCHQGLPYPEISETGIHGKGA